jgi:DNA modification methylase
LKELEENSVDAVCTDPPYALTPSKGAKGGFMGKLWDAEVPSVEIWKEVIRVLKPGGHLLSFGGTRTYHRMVVNIEDAGFEIRDQLQWLYGSGFPKSLDISKAIDKKFGAKREVIGESKSGSSSRAFQSEAQTTAGVYNHTAPSTPEAYRYKGWGTALKPANEPIVLARKPLSEKTVAENMLKWGVGGLNIDESRIDLQDGETTHGSGKSQSNDPNTAFGDMGEKRVGVPNIKSTQGRWPANLLLGCDCEGEEHGQMCAVKMLDEQSGQLHLRGNKKPTTRGGGMYGHSSFEGTIGHSESGHSGASRFFYVAKSSKRERNAGLEGMPLKKSSKLGDGIQSNVGNGTPGESSSEDRLAQNFHPTVKPIKLMEYLIKLITPPGGVVLDPFMGSGSTGVAAFKNGFKFIGIEMNEEYVAIAEKRIANAKEPA